MIMLIRKRRRKENLRLIKGRKKRIYCKKRVCFAVGFVHHRFSQAFFGLTVKFIVRIRGRFKIQNRGQDLSGTRSNETDGRDNEATKQK